MTKFKVGDRVLVGPNGLIGAASAAGKYGVVKSIESYGYDIRLDDQTVTNRMGVRTSGGLWAAGDENLTLVAPDGGTEMRSPTIAPSKRTMSRASYRLNQAILKHLESGKSISPMEALVVHGCLRLAAAICDLRQAGHIIKTDIHHDTNGKQYARYSLIKDERIAA